MERGPPGAQARVRHWGRDGTQTHSGRSQETEAAQCEHRGQENDDADRDLGGAILVLTGPSQDNGIPLGGGCLWGGDVTQTIRKSRLRSAQDSVPASSGPQRGPARGQDCEGRGGQEQVSRLHCDAQRCRDARRDWLCFFQNSDL